MAILGPEAFGSEIGSGAEKAPPGGRTDATTSGLPASMRVQTAITVPSGATAVSAPRGLSAPPGSVVGAIHSAARAEEDTTANSASAAASATTTRETVASSIGCIDWVLVISEAKAAR